MNRDDGTAPVSYGKNQDVSKEPIFVPRRGYHHGSLKDALVDAARLLVAERGAAGFTLSEAAKRVGVTSAAPYRHFADRNGLMDELARRGFDLFTLKLDEAFDEGRPDPVRAFERMGEAYLAFARAEPGLYGAMFAREGALATPGPKAAAERALASLQRGTAAILAVTGRAGLDPAPLALQVWAFSHGVATLFLSGQLAGTPQATDANAMLRDGVAALLAGARGAGA